MQRIRIFVVLSLYYFPLSSALFYDQISEEIFDFIYTYVCIPLNKKGYEIHTISNAVVVYKTLRNIILFNETNQTDFYKIILLSA